jgi:hypothetical protein
MRGRETPNLRSALDKIRFTLAFREANERAAEEWVDRYIAAGHPSPYQSRELAFGEWAKRYVGQPYRPSNLVLALEVDRGTEPETFAQAVASVVTDCPALRATFRQTRSQEHYTTGRSLVEVRAAGNGFDGLFEAGDGPVVPIPVLSISLEPEQSTAALSPYEPTVFQIIDRLSSEPFNRTVAPTIRALLFPSQGRGMLAVLVADHVNADWYTMAELGKGVATSLLRDPQPGSRRLGPSRVSKRRLRRRAVIAVADLRNRWREPEAAPIAVGDMPFATPHSDFASLAFGCVGTLICGELYDALKRAARATTASIEECVFGALSVVIQHATQRTRISIWTERRDDALCSDGLGSLSNQHVVSISLLDSKLTPGILMAVRRGIADASRIAVIPIDVAARAAGKTWTPPGDQVTFQHHRVVFSGARASRVQVLPVVDTDPRLALQVHSAECPSCLTLSLCYLKSRLETATAEQVLEDIVSVLWAFAAFGDDEERRSLQGAAHQTALRVTGGLVACSGPSRCYLCEARRHRGWAGQTPILRHQELPTQP